MSPRPTGLRLPGLVGLCHLVCKVCPGLDPQRAEGGISDAASGVVGGRCVLSTGVRFDSPLEVAWPVPLPCATPFLHSDAYRSSLRTCALDW